MLDARGHTRFVPWCCVSVKWDDLGLTPLLRRVLNCGCPGLVVLPEKSLGIKDDPTRVVIAGAIHTNQAFLFEAFNGAYVISHSITLDRNLWYETWSVRMFLPVI